MFSSLFLLNERGYSISVQFSLYCSELFVWSCACILDVSVTNLLLCIPTFSFQFSAAALCTNDILGEESDDRFVLLSAADFPQRQNSSWAFHLISFTDADNILGGKCYADQRGVFFLLIKVCNSPTLHSLNWEKSFWINSWCGVSV